MGAGGRGGGRHAGRGGGVLARAGVDAHDPRGRPRPLGVPPAPGVDGHAGRGDAGGVGGGLADAVRVRRGPVPPASPGPPAGAVGVGRRLAARGPAGPVRRRVVPRDGAPVAARVSPGGPGGGPGGPVRLARPRPLRFRGPPRPAGADVAAGAPRDPGSGRQLAPPAGRPAGRPGLARRPGERHRVRPARADRLLRGRRGAGLRVSPGGADRAAGRPAGGRAGVAGARPGVGPARPEDRGTRRSRDLRPLPDHRRVPGGRPPVLPPRPLLGPPAGVDRGRHRPLRGPARGGPP